MRLLSQAIAQKLFLDSFPQIQPSVELAREIRDVRDDLVKRTDKVIVFLFSTLMVIALVNFDVSAEAKIFGIEIKRKEHFIYTALVIGNLLYVVTTGAFLKVFILEFFLFYTVTHKRFSGSRVTSAMLYTYPANIFAALKFNNSLGNANWFAQKVFDFSRAYSRYLLILIYSIFYFFILFDFLAHLWSQAPAQPYSFTFYFFFWSLILLNFLSTLTSFAIFLPATLGAQHAREGRLAEPERRMHNTEGVRSYPLVYTNSDKRNQLAKSRQKLKSKR